MDLILPHIEINRYPSFKMEHSCAWYCIFLDYVVRYCKIFENFEVNCNCRCASTSISFCSAISCQLCCTCVVSHIIIPCSELHCSALSLLVESLIWFLIALLPSQPGAVQYCAKQCLSAVPEYNASQWIALHCMHCSTAWRCRPVPWWWNLPMDSLSEQAGN